MTTQGEKRSVAEDLRAQGLINVNFNGDASELGVSHLMTSAVTREAIKKKGCNASI